MKTNSRQRGTNRMFCYGSNLIDLARVRQAELLRMAQQERLVKQALSVQRSLKLQKSWRTRIFTRLGRWMIACGTRLLKPESQPRTIDVHYVRAVAPIRPKTTRPRWPGGLW
ncbi:hypothetical protein HY230_12510 [Candidatus Acetothermia bacterium]|nr:hypothetical protein [Candidatus Acetothermia bacterium]